MKIALQPAHLACIPGLRAWTSCTLWDVAQRAQDSLTDVPTAMVVVTEPSFPPQPRACADMSLPDEESRRHLFALRGRRGSTRCSPPISFWTLRLSTEEIERLTAKRAVNAAEVWRMGVRSIQSASGRLNSPLLRRREIRVRRARLSLRRD